MLATGSQFRAAQLKQRIIETIIRSTQASRFAPSPYVKGGNKAERGVPGSFKGWPVFSASSEGYNPTPVRRAFRRILRMRRAQADAKAYALQQRPFKH